jgi:hypothetical protein
VLGPHRNSGILSLEEKKKIYYVIVGMLQMVTKMKAKFIPRDYQTNMFRRMQNLRQKVMTVKEYTEEFYRLNIISSHHESDDEKVSRYMKGLRYEILDEMRMVIIINVEDAYQMLQKLKKSWPESKVKGAEVEVKAEANQLPKTECKIPRMNKRDLIITLKGEEAHKEDNMLIGTLFLEQEEEEEAEEVK